ncbi:hypothetical protein [Pseudofrankia asymbiotica]|uniref:Uncharacterized protein n=1 Tax=Pseudofrankia asymbiotica TaxID=1834516 RepID=A0A1V2ICB4_9ACTN|nr:hypothetical protein [Pseudofrankia asymbiotica]ONH30804.1 hypothetical protein BL253_11835 [Pseudofrankia asymbiotica]
MPHTKGSPAETYGHDIAAGNKVVIGILTPMAGFRRAVERPSTAGLAPGGINVAIKKAPGDDLPVRAAYVSAAAVTPIRTRPPSLWAMA